MRSIPDTLAEQILHQIQGGATTFRAPNVTPESLTDFQATVKRIEWLKDEGYIKDAKPLHIQPGIALYVEIVGGLTLEGEQALLGDSDARAF